MPSSQLKLLCNVSEEMSDPTGELTNKPFTAQLSNVYFSILALFCFKLFVKISLNLLAYFYIVRGNRKEAARISAEFYDYTGQQREYSDKNITSLEKFFSFIQVVSLFHTLHQFEHLYLCVKGRFYVICNHYTPRNIFVLRRGGS